MFSGNSNKVFGTVPIYSHEALYYLLVDAKSTYSRTLLSSTPVVSIVNNLCVHARAPANRPYLRVSLFWRNAYKWSSTSVVLRHQRTPHDESHAVDLQGFRPMASAPLKIIKNPLRRKMTSAGEEGCVGESRNRIGQNCRAAELMCDERHMGARVHVRCYVFPSSAFSLLPFNVVWCVEFLAISA